MLFFWLAPPQGVSVPQYTGAIPENEAPTEQQSAPTAPPLEKMDAIPGYQNIGFTECKLVFDYIITVSHMVYTRKNNTIKKIFTNQENRNWINDLIINGSAWQYGLWQKAMQFRMETGNVLKRQQPDYRAEHSTSPPMGLQHSKKIPHPEARISWLQ